ncbi:nucleoside tri-diphosphate phosphatase [Terribacillus saccharophilus]|uniref:Nucleoside triphosphate/diphosphate phosphatase n=1 Tax=Terribacillus saccharophilus TaxID=361277 RepID=A0A268AAW9_9BACI|nr:DUF402 domain-containing protein [Terribacillus saccharophilus]PAD21277.1 hypothetical protein CHH64_10130 [Terribacillus saccharophilus]PAF17024.1 hypothetical protein CHH51_14120 [Terribacillus saccharophilus]PAF21131.1 hypothetical protein CHH49_13915 [Terribacillus saccharophilus]PAF36076.1 hypothetical protein CHH58_14080 [Terribacillus saccharophilus]PAF39795.1 hypothetical protein CHH69_06245 [Terribacillus saccharophilus]
MAGPEAGTKIQIHSFKHNGQLHRVWESSTVLKSTAEILIGANDRTMVTESDGRTWITREPAIVYFHAKYWFNIIGMLRTDGIYYYCNISSPYVYDGEALKYIDYDLDIKIYPDMTFTLLDEDEFNVHKRQMNYPPEIERILWNQVDILISWIRQGKGPFSPDFIDTWYELFLTYR